MAGENGVKVCGLCKKKIFLCSAKFTAYSLQLISPLSKKSFFGQAPFFFSTRVGSGLLTNLNQPGSAKVSEREPKRQLLASAEFSITKLDSFV